MQKTIAPNIRLIRSAQQRYSFQIDTEKINTVSKKELAKFPPKPPPPAPSVTTKSNLALFWSGGKDSYLALYRAHKDGHRVKFLILASYKDSQVVHFHYIPKELIYLQAHAAGIPIIEINTSPAEYIQDMKALFSFLRKENIGGVATGCSNDMRDMDAIYNYADAVGIKIFNPLAGLSEFQIWEQILASRVHFLIVLTEGKIPKPIIGTSITPEVIEYLYRGREKLEKGFSMFNSRNYHSFVIDGPLFKQEIVIENDRVLEMDNFNYLLMRSGYLKKKEKKTKA